MYNLSIQTHKTTNKQNAVDVSSDDANHSYYLSTSGKLPKYYRMYCSKHEGESRANISALFMTLQKYIIYQNRYRLPYNYDDKVIML